MSDQLTTGIITVFMALVGLATLAVVLSRNANTSGVVASVTQGFAQDLGAATAPVTGGGGGFSGMTSYGSAGLNLGNGL